MEREFVGAKMDTGYHKQMDIAIQVNTISLICPKDL